MKNILLSAVLVVPALSGAAFAQESRPLPVELADPAPAAASRFPEVGFSVLQEEIAPELHFGLSLSLRIDVPGGGSVDSDDNVAYSDIFDVGLGLALEANLMSRLSPKWYLGGYVSIGWDQFIGASDVDMGTGEFFSFDNQNVITAILGAKVLHHFAPAWFWEGRMGIGLVHYDQLTFSDTTNVFAPIDGLQFFKPATHGLFDLAGRVGVGGSHVTFDVGIDFRFMGGEARGRDVTNVVDPQMFFVFTFDLGLSVRF
jgi:hypothetical protein